METPSVTLFCQGADWKPRKSLKEPGTCGACGAPLVGRNHWFCPSRRGTANTQESCAGRYMANHRWGEARREALRRAGMKCARCGLSGRGRAYRGVAASLPNLEVNHRVPREGRGYGVGCWNHQDNLEVLCHQDHVAETTRQIRDRRGLGPTKRSRLEDKLARWTAWARQ